MEFTGERVIPGQTDPDLMNEHWARYFFAGDWVADRRVLDAGCGVGYGAARLAESASQVVALDLALEPLRDGAQRYQHPCLRFVQGDCRRLPFADRSFDAVVAFEVIEHLEEWRNLLAEARRVLAPAGLFVVSTPNRLYYGESRAEPNPFHVHEFGYEEFQTELSRFFPHRKIFLENHTDAISFQPLEVAGARTRIEESKLNPEEAHFFLAICSGEPLADSPAFVYVPNSGNVLRERERHIRLLEEELAQKTQWLQETTESLKELSEEHLADQKSAQEAIDGLLKENQVKTEWAEKLKEELASVQADLAKCVNLLDKAEQTVIERSEWAKRLDRELMAIYVSLGYKIGRRLGLVPEPYSLQDSPSASSSEAAPAQEDKSP